MLGQRNAQAVPEQPFQFPPQLPAKKRSRSQRFRFGSMRLAQYANLLPLGRNQNTVVPNISTLLAAAGFTPEKPAQADSTIELHCTSCGALTRMPSTWTSNSVLNLANGQTDLHLNFCMFLTRADLAPTNAIYTGSFYSFYIH